MADAIEIGFLGTASCSPSLTRNVTCTAVRIGGEIWLFDTGEGTQHQILRSNFVKPGKVSRIFVTHLHGDHLYGLPGLLCTLNSGKGCEDLEQAPIVDIIGPQGITQYVRFSLGCSYSNLAYRIRIIELMNTHLYPNDQPVVPFELTASQTMPFEIDRVQVQPTETNEGTSVYWDIPSDCTSIDSVRATPMRHTVPCVGYMIQEKVTPGALDASLVKPRLESNREALKAQGIKNPMMLMGRIKKGETVQLPDGTTVSPADVIGPPRPGRKLAIFGDTAYAPLALETVRGCDALVHEATNAKISPDDDEKTYEEIEENTKSHGHSTPQMAGSFAAQAEVKHLFLTHFSARYKGDVQTEPTSLAVMDQIATQAREASANTVNVTCAYDHLVVSIPKRDRG